MQAPELPLPQHRTRNEGNGDQADRDDQQCRGCGFGDPFKTGLLVGACGERVEVEGPQEKRCGKFLHAVDENQKQSRRDRAFDHRHIDVAQRSSGRLAKSARGERKARRDPAHSGICRALPDCEKPNRIGVDEHHSSAGQDEARIIACQRQNAVREPVVDSGERDQEANRQTRSALLECDFVRGAQLLRDCG